jgi:thiol-disulfide isomerase/thioredoxin
LPYLYDSMQINLKAIRKISLLLISGLLLSFGITSRVRVVNVDQLQQECERNNDTLYVVNFWATWCVPCIKELPVFKAAYQKYAGDKVKMIYVSLNSAKELPQVEKFAADKALNPEVLLLNAGNPNVWINRVDSNWSGTIPATALYSHGKKIYFHEGDFTQDKLDSLIQSKHNNR